ncbi:MAG TPA: response regulator [Vicinamibacteria bacterium]|jgi:DNA-binding response OmpR family regulator|nr:response regulator [Vicinamibacteria bacterium]
MTPRPRLLIVDDEPLISSSMGRFFQAEGFHVDCASELDEAQRLVAAGGYDVLIADLRLTGAGSTEGLDLIAFASHRSPRTRAILLTSYGSPEIEREALRRGAHAMIVKPKALPELAEVVASLLPRHEG